jgi:predicted acylesterase/phospholipase RssA
MGAWPRTPQLAAVACAALVLWPGRSLAAAEGGLPMPAALADLDGPPALALTISGGVSLGAYEAGQLHYLVELLKANPGLGQLRLVTGASAGSTNGIMTVLALYAPAPRPLAPTAGLFWKTWIPLGLAQLRAGPHGSAQGALSRGWMDRLAEELEGAWRAGLREDCDVVLGVSVTRLVPRQMQTPAEGLELPRIEEKFAVRIRGRGAGRPPRLTNYVSGSYRWPQLLLPEGPEGEVPFSALRDLIFASTAFPVAFPPQPLAHCVAAARDGAPPRCPPEELRTDLFVDGGLLDNAPLRLAARLAGSGLRDDGRGGTRWLDSPDPTRFEPAARTLFAYVTPDAAAYPPAEGTTRIDATTALLGLTGQLGSAFVDTARAKNVTTLLEEYPHVADRILVPLRHYPAASQPMAAFFGFFERSFREFDFFLGMYDARRMVLEGILPAVRRVDPAYQPVMPDEGTDPEAWRPLDCLRAVLGERPGAEAICAIPGIAQYRILAQASIFRLWDQCTLPDGKSGRRTSHAHCEAAQLGRPPPLVPGVERAAAAAWRHRPEEGEVAYTVRLLGELGFWWKDLGLAAGEGDEALPRLREAIGEVARGLAGRQPVEDRFVVGSLAGLAANSLTYEAPAWLGWLTLGRQLEVGASRRVDVRALSALRLHAAVQVHGILSAISSDRARVAPALLLGIELRPQRLATVTWQPAAVLRVGAVVTPRDDYGAGTCDEAARDTAACTRPVAQAGLTLSVLESARLQFMAEWYPRGAAGQRALWAVSPSLGVQLPF